MRSMKDRHTWVLAAPPPLDGKSFDEVRHGYVFTGSGEIRIRRAGGHCFLTVAGGRRKWETEIEEWVFDAMWPATKGNRLRKRRYSWREGRRGVALDVYEGKLEGLIVLEAAELPDWATGAIEVTGDPNFENEALAVNGIKAIRRRLQQPLHA